MEKSVCCKSRDAPWLVMQQAVLFYSFSLSMLLCFVLYTGFVSNNFSRFSTECVGYGRMAETIVWTFKIMCGTVTSRSQTHTRPCSAAKHVLDLPDHLLTHTYMHVKGTAENLFIG